MIRQKQPQKNTGRSSREQGTARITIILAIVIVMITGIVGACVYYFWYDARTSEQSANAMLPETEIYASINLRPEKSELYKLGDIFQRFKENNAFDEGYNDILNNFENNNGVDIEDDIIPWLEELAFGVTTNLANSEDVDIVVLGGTSDREASLSAIEKILDHTRENNDFEFEETEYRGYDYIFNEDDDMYLAVAKDYVILCNSEDLFTNVIDLIADGGESLADQPKFQKARDEMPSNRVGFFYMDTEAMFNDTFEETMSDYEYNEQEQQQIDMLEQNIPEYMVASVQCIDYGLKIDYYTKYSEQMDQDFLVMENNELKSMEMIPADALGLISFYDISTMWDQQLSYMDEETKQEIAETQRDMRRDFGHDLDDIFSLLDGEIAITMLPGGMYISPDGEFNGMPHVAALIEVGGKNEMDIFMEDLNELILEDGEIVMGQIDILGEEAIVFSDPAGDNEMASYMYLDDYLVVGLTQDALAKIVNTRNGTSPSLVENDAMMRPLGLVKDVNSVFYLNIQGIIDQVLELVSDEAVDTYNREYACYFEPFETSLVTGSGATNNTQLYNVGSFIITLSSSPAVDTPTSTSVDSDGDGWTDEHEKSMKTNPYSADTDKDGIIDSEDPDPLPADKPDTTYELKNIRLAVTALMADAGVDELDAAYYDVDTHDEVHSVTAGNGIYTMGLYLDVGAGESLAQSYDIERNGMVTPSSLTTSDIVSQDTEMKNVRLATTALMADHGISEITPQLTWTNDLNNDIVSGADSGAIGDYLEPGKIAYYYTWESDGTMHQCKKQGCATPWISGQPEPTLVPPPETTIVIGNLTDLTGPYANGLHALNTALSDLIYYYNSNDLIPGVELDVITYDGQYNPARDIPGYQWLKSRGSTVIFTPVSTSPTTLRSMADEDGTVLFALNADERDLMPPGYVFNLSSAPRYDAYTLLKWIAENDWDYTRNGPAKIGAAAWDETYTAAFFDAMEEYCQAHPDQFEWEGGFLTDYSFIWGPEVEALKDCDYVFPPLMMTNFAKEFRTAGCSAKFIGTEAHLPYYGRISQTEAWDEVDGMLLALSHRWWDEQGPIIDLTKMLLYENHPANADEIVEGAPGYLAIQNMYVMLEIIRETVNEVGPENFDSEALFNTAQSYSFVLDGIERYSYSSTKRTAVNYVGIYEAIGSEEDLFMVEPEWIPIVQEP